MAELPANDSELLRQLATGDEAAFLALYDRYQGAIFRFCWHMSADHTTAEEVTQDVFLQLIRHPGGYDPARGSLAGYLFGIARNLTRRALGRRPQGELPLDDCPDASAAAGESDFLGTLDRQQRLECLRESLLALPASYREVVVLCDLEEMTYPDAAALLGCAPGTVASRLHRARALLKRRLLRRLNGPVKSAAAVPAKNQGCAP